MKRGKAGEGVKKSVLKELEGFFPRLPELP